MIVSDHTTVRLGRPAVGNGLRSQFPGARKLPGVFELRTPDPKRSGSPAEALRRVGHTPQPATAPRRAIACGWGALKLGGMSDDLDLSLPLASSAKRQAAASFSRIERMARVGLGPAVGESKTARPQSKPHGAKFERSVGIASMLELRRPILQRWADFICPADNVVTLKGGAA